MDTPFSYSAEDQAAAWPDEYWGGESNTPFSSVVLPQQQPSPSPFIFSDGPIPKDIETNKRVQRAAPEPELRLPPDYIPPPYDAVNSKEAAIGRGILEGVGNLTGINPAMDVLLGKMTPEEQWEFFLMAVPSLVGAGPRAGSAKGFVTPETMAKIGTFLRSEEGSLFTKNYDGSSGPLWRNVVKDPEVIESTERYLKDLRRSGASLKSPILEDQHILRMYRSRYPEHAAVLSDRMNAPPPSVEFIKKTTRGPEKDGNDALIADGYRNGLAAEEIAERLGGGISVESIRTRMSALRREQPDLYGDVPKAQRTLKADPIFQAMLESNINNEEKLLGRKIERGREDMDYYNVYQRTRRQYGERRELEENNFERPKVTSKEEALAQEQKEFSSLKSGDFDVEPLKDKYPREIYNFLLKNHPEIKTELESPTGTRSVDPGLLNRHKWLRRIQTYLGHEGSTSNLNLPSLSQEEKVFNPQEQKALLNEFSEFLKDPELTRTLANHLPRARSRVIELVKQGKSTAEIAQRLGISTKTVRVHKHNARKLGEFRHGGRIGYADGGDVEDWGAIPATSEASEDWGAIPAENQSWRGYVPVIGAGLAQGAITGIGKAMQGLPELYADKPEESSISQWGKAIEQYGTQNFPLSPEEQKSISGQVAKSIGTVAPVIAGGVATPALGIARGIAGLAATGIGAGQMGLIGAAEQGERARKAGASPETAREAAIWGAVGNATLGLLPFHMILKPLERASPAIKDWAVTKLQAAAKSGVTFAGIGEAQSWLGEEIAKDLYDPKAGYSFDVERAYVGLLSGAVLGTARREVVRGEETRPQEGITPTRLAEQGTQQRLDQLLAGERQLNTDRLDLETQRNIAPAERPPVRPVEERAPVERVPALSYVNPNELMIDSQRFRAPEQTAIPGERAPVERPETNTPILAYENLNGDKYVVNGNERAEVASLDTKMMLVRMMREVDGIKPEYAKAVGSYQNLFEGKRPETEVNRILGANAKGIVERLGEVPSAQRLVEDTRGLASLHPEAFGLVQKAKVPETYAAEISRLFQGQAEQMKAIEALAKAKPESMAEARRVINEIPPEQIRSLNEQRNANEKISQSLKAEAARQAKTAQDITQATKAIAAARGEPRTGGTGPAAIRPQGFPRLRSVPGRQLERLQQRLGDRGLGLKDAAAAIRGPTTEPSLAAVKLPPAKRQAAERAITDIIEGIVGKRVKVEFPDRILLKKSNRGGYGGSMDEVRTAGGIYYPLDRLIKIAMADKNYPDQTTAARHESFHVVQDLLATPRELKVLKAEDAKLRSIVGRDLELTPEQIGNMSSVEVQAHAYDIWSKSGMKEVGWPVKQFFSKVKEFFQRLRNALHGLGFRNAEDIFQFVSEGKMAGRESSDAGQFYRQAAGYPHDLAMIGPTGPKIKQTVPDTTLGPIAKKYSDLIDRMGLGDVVRDLQIKLTPMAARDATIESRAAAKDFANQIQEARYTKTSLDDIIAKDFTQEQQKKMWEAADAESVALQIGKPAVNGLESLTPKERQFVKRIQKRADETFDEAKKLGIYEGDEKLPSYVTRLVLMNKGGGKYEYPSLGEYAKRLYGPKSSAIRTTTAQMIDRKYLTAEETEQAAKAKFGQEAEVLRNIRVLPYATGLLQEAVAGRKLIERIKEAGKEAGAETVTEGDKPQGNWFTIDHPAFYNSRDVNGTIQRTPIYVRSDFEGPLRSVLEQGSSSKIYQSLMSLKGKTMGLIMMSPMIHNQVEWGRALPAMPGKVLTGRIYFEGNKAKNDPKVMREAIRGGLVPIGHRGFMQDITSVQEAPNLAPGRSLTSKVLAAVPGLFSKTAGDAVKRAVDKAGDFWHNTLLWDRIGDLQMGLYTNLRDNLIKKGFDPQTSQRTAAHWANRYAGAIPLEAMSVNARKIANLLMFSRSFTLGNIGAMKDTYAGLPRDVQAQIARDAGPEVLGRIKSVARRKATMIMAIDIGLFYVMGSLLQSAMNTMGAGQTMATLGGALGGAFAGSMIGGPLGAVAGAAALGYAGNQLVTSTGGKTLDEEIEGYKKRFAEIQKRTREHPFEVLNPFSPYKGAEMLSATSENEPGKHDRVLVGYEKDGTAVYGRFPMGKIGEEFMGWQTSPLDMMHKKLSTWARPLSEIWANDKGFGRKVYDKNADLTTWEQVKNVGRIAWHLMKSQVPVDWGQSIADYASGHGDETTNLLKSVGPIAGMTFSKGAPTGPEYGDILKEKEKQKFAIGENLDTIRRLVQDGKVDEAVKLMIDMKLDKHDIQTFVRIYSGGPRVTKGAARKFSSSASPEAVEELRRHMEDAAKRRGAASKDDWSTIPAQP